MIQIQSGQLKYRGHIIGATCSASWMQVRALQQCCKLILPRSKGGEQCSVNGTIHQLLAFHPPQPRAPSTQLRRDPCTRHVYSTANTNHIITSVVGSALLLLCGAVSRALQAACVLSGFVAAARVKRAEWTATPQMDSAPQLWGTLPPRHLHRKIALSTIP